LRRALLFDLSHDILGKKNFFDPRIRSPKITIGIFTLNVYDWVTWLYIVTNFNLFYLENLEKICCERQTDKQTWGWSYKGSVFMFLITSYGILKIMNFSGCDILWPFVYFKILVLIDLNILKFFLNTDLNMRQKVFRTIWKFVSKTCFFNL